MAKKVLILSGDLTYSLELLDNVQLKTEVEITGSANFKKVSFLQKNKIAEAVKAGDFDCIVIRDAGVDNVAVGKIELIEENLRLKIVLVSQFSLADSGKKPFKEMGVRHFTTTNNALYYVEKLLEVR